MTNYSLDVLAYRVQDLNMTVDNTSRDLALIKRKLEKAENRIALLEMTLKATVEVMSKLQDRIEELQDLVEKGVIK